MDEVLISRAITESFLKDFISAFELDVAIAGAGPAGLVCGYFLAREKYKVAIFERQLRVGGGMPGGGMMFNRIVIQEEARSILEEAGVRLQEYREGLLVADSLEAVSALCLQALRAGVKIFNLMHVEDVLIRRDKICGLVLNWSAVSWSKLHVDPLAVKADFVVDASGHDAEVCRVAERKIGAKLSTPDGKVAGEKSMWAEAGEREILKNTCQVYPGLITCGMAANAVFGSPRMGAIFGGMLLSGKRAAQLVKKT